MFSIALLQVGSYPVDQAWWGRPEDMTMGRPYYSSLSGSSDLAGAVVGGLAASSCALNQSNPQLAAQLLTAAQVIAPCMHYKGQQHFHDLCCCSCIVCVPRCNTKLE